MVNASVEITSSVPTADLRSRAAKSNQAAAGTDFGALIDSNAAEAKSAPVSPTSPTPARTQPTAREASARSSGDRKDQPSPKVVTTSQDNDHPAEPTSPQENQIAAAEIVISETPVVAVVLGSIATLATDAGKVEKDATTADASAETDASGTADILGIQPVVTGIVAPVAIALVIAAPTASDTAQPVPADPLNGSATSAVKTAQTSTPTPVVTQPVSPTATTSVGDQVVTPAPTITPDVTDPPVKAKIAVVAQSQTADTSDVGLKTDAATVTTSTDLKVAAADSLAPAPEAKPQAEHIADAEKPEAKVEAKADAKPQPDAPAPVRQTRDPHAATAEARVDNASLADAPVQQTTAAQHVLPSPPPSAAPAVAQPINASVQLGSNIAVPVSGLAVNIAFNANAGRSRFEIRLDPAELGRIDVRLDVDRNGQVTSHLTVERPATLDMLRRDAPQLQRALEDAGLKTGDSGLQFSLRDQSQQQSGSDDKSSRGQSYRLVVDETPALPAEAGRTYARLAAARGGIDIRI